MVSIASMGDSKDDEMAIKSIVKRPAILDTDNIGTSDPTGTVLWFAPVNPGYTANSTSSGQVRTTPMTFVASQFALWRGSINYKIDVVATQFHTCRLILAFLSGVFTVPAILNPSDLETVPRIVIDVQGSTEMTYSVPYNVAPPYLKVRVASENSTGINFSRSDLMAPDKSPGIIVLVIDNELKCPDTVPQIIPINIWVWGGDDLVFAVPTSDNYCVVPLPAPTAKEAEKREKKKKERETQHAKFYAKSDLNTVPKAVNVKPGPDAVKATAFTPKNLTPKHVQFAGLVIGENNVNNIRTLCRMMSPVWEDTLPPNNLLEIDPAWFQSTDTVVDSRVNHWAHIFAGWRGGTEYILYPYEVIVPYPTWSISSDLTESTTIDSPNVFTSFTDTAIGFSQIVATNNTPFLEFSLPYYAGTSLWSVVTDSGGLQRPLVRVQPDFTAAVPYALLMSKRDDFSFYKLCGAPNMKLRVAL